MDPGGRLGGKTTKKEETDAGEINIVTPAKFSLFFFRSLTARLFLFVYSSGGSSRPAGR